MVMQMYGEKEVFPGFPRGHILFGKLSKLKHEIKNQIFNESWKFLEEGVSHERIADHVKRKIPQLYAILDAYKYDIVPPERLSPAVREIYRAWTKVARGERSYQLRDMLCHILQEDDSYRWRVQWLVKYFNPRHLFFSLGSACGFGNPIPLFDKALGMLEHGEIIGDMKERQRLLRRILMSVLKDESIRQKFLALCKEVDWKKVQLSKADLYFFRGKYFKVDYDLFDY